MAPKKKIKNIEKSSPGKLTVQESKDYNKYYIIFSLERIVSGNYCFSELQNDDKKQFAEAIFKRKNMTWDDILKAHRHGLGNEKISVDSVKQEKPKFITADTSYYLAFRFNGKKAMVGYRQKNIFYVLWFDHNFTLYNH
jgi:hypothetical protein